MKPSTAVVVALTAVACTLIAALTLVVVTVDKSEVPEGWLALFLATLSTVIATLVGLARTEKIGRQVDDLSNGKMDAKIRRAVAEVLRPDMVDPEARPQLERDRAVHAASALLLNRKDSDALDPPRRDDAEGER